MTSTSDRTALVTGATGYIGGLLVPRLLEAGWRVRVLARHRAALDTAPWRDAVDVVEGDAASDTDARRALDGIRVAYFLIHSMGGDDDFAGRDRRLATTFARAAREAGVRRIVYLGGLHPDGALSAHLASRVEVGRILLGSGVPTAVLQAAVVLGHGSASFEMLRFLASRLPAMVAPKWLHNRIQPIATDDVLHYLVGAADLPADVSRTFDIGGPEVLTYEQMLQRFAALTGRRRRLIVTVPVLTPRLASHWVGLVTPVSGGLATPLVESLVHEVVCAEHDIERHVPDPDGGLTGFDAAIRTAMRDAPRDTGPRTLAAVTAATVASAALGSLATQPDARWYRALDLPRWQPPAAAFPVVWTALYADIIATSSAALTTLDREGRRGDAAACRRALAANLVLNAAWSVVFWRLRRPGLAAAEAALLAASSADLARRVGSGSRARGRALAPYAVWCGFAAVLSAAIGRRNRPSQRPHAA
ncbi:MAG TPA: tryptophan-rich sensory protein [Intrasporangium sp.]|uniref:tryptophan-rich sensory protein n=1 Tax=Intrasporangium sp. TaxID=1925024 RepID=UPI002D77A03B|nr:tryptophan-rich sensory protein [Intrasporangium sp.]HET7399844.1 tryptophan-rich sensory protein [Intrasporangium sp.]